MERLAAVFTAATSGTSHQVLVLTCSPARYRGIGAARTVTLSPSLPPPAAVSSAVEAVEAVEPAAEPSGGSPAESPAVGEDPLRDAG